MRGAGLLWPVRRILQQTHHWSCSLTWGLCTWDRWRNRVQGSDRTRTDSRLLPLRSTLCACVSLRWCAAATADDCYCVYHTEGSRNCPATPANTLHEIMWRTVNIRTARINLWAPTIGSAKSVGMVICFSSIGWGGDVPSDALFWLESQTSNTCWMSVTAIKPVIHSDYV